MSSLPRMIFVIRLPGELCLAWWRHSVIGTANISLPLLDKFHSCIEPPLPMQQRSVWHEL